MSRPRKPTAHLELVGAFQKNPQRKREHEPQPDGEPIHPPLGLDADEIACWDFLIDTAAPGVLTKMDSMSLALCSKALSVVWNGRAELDKNGETFIKSATITEIRAANAMLGQLGMTPADRSKVVVPKQSTGSKFEKFKRG